MFFRLTSLSTIAVPGINPLIMVRLFANFSEEFHEATFRTTVLNHLSVSRELR